MSVGPESGPGASQERWPSSGRPALSDRERRWSIIITSSISGLRPADRVAAADVRDYAQLAQVLDDGVRQLGRLDVFFANTGILIVTSSTTGL